MIWTESEVHTYIYVSYSTSPLADHTPDWTGYQDPSFTSSLWRQVILSPGCMMVIQCGLAVASADGQLYPAEIALSKEIAQILDVTTAQANRPFARRPDRRFAF